MRDERRQRKGGQKAGEERAVQGGALQVPINPGQSSSSSSGPALGTSVTAAPGASSAGPGTRCKAAGLGSAELSPVPSLPRGQQGQRGLQGCCPLGWFPFPCTAAPHSTWEMQLDVNSAALSVPGCWSQAHPALASHRAAGEQAAAQPLPGSLREKGRPGRNAEAVILRGPVKVHSPW